MTVTTRTSAPSYKIFEPDVLDQIYANKVFDPVMGGFAGALGSFHKMNKAGYQDDYLASQEKFNKMAGNIDAMEIAQKQKEALLKGAVQLLGHGAATTDFDPGSVSGLLTAQGYQNDTLGKAIRDKMIAEAQRARAGDGDKLKSIIKYSTTPPGTNQTIEETYQYKPGEVLPPSRVRATNPTGSTSVSTNANATATTREQVAILAKAAAGPDAKLMQQSPEGASLWAGSKGTAVFDPNGKLDRNQSKLR